MEQNYIKELYKIYSDHNVITTDSRNCPQGSIFFALKGENFNGNLFAEKALEAGCAFAVIDEKEYKKDDRFILVDNVLEALQQLALYHRQQLTIPVIGITGTNGKTTTKELTRTVLAQKYNVIATEGNLNNHIGVPLTLLKIRKENEIAVIEMGANHQGEIEELCNMVLPTHGIITNVGRAHLEGFKSFEGVIKTKTELYASLKKTGGTIFIYDKNKELIPYTEGIKTVYYGNSENDYLFGWQTSCTPFLSFEFYCGDSPVAVDTKLIGGYNLPNALAAVTFGKYFGVADENIKAALESYEPANKRSQLTKTENNTLILDAYNANPTSMMAALKNFREMEVEKKMLILGDMRELGAESHNEHQKIVDYIVESMFKDVILVGPEFKQIENSFVSLNNADELNLWLSEHPVKDYFILIKGSRGIALEKGIEKL